MFKLNPPPNHTHFPVHSNAPDEINSDLPLITKITDTFLAFGLSSAPTWTTIP